MMSGAPDAFFHKRVRILRPSRGAMQQVTIQIQRSPYPYLSLHALLLLL
jgi:hypothetical protein